jgi:hypothetical protein
MKKTSKKIIGGLMVVGLLATIGAVVVSASPGIFSNLTDKQKDDLRELRQELRDEGATWEEMREAMKIQLEEYGVELPSREEMIDQRIEHAEKRLEILNIIKDLITENPEITQEEIREILEEDYGIEMPDGESMMSRRGFRRGFCGGPCGFVHGEESE